MADRRDDPMRLWIGTWTPEKPSRPVPPRKQEDEKVKVPEDTAEPTGD